MVEQDGELLPWSPSAHGRSIGLAMGLTVCTNCSVTVIISHVIGHLTKPLQSSSLPCLALLHFAKESDQGLFFSPAANAQGEGT